MTENQIIKLLEKSGIDTKNIQVDSVFSDHRIDSLDIFSLLLEVQEISGVSIPDDDIDTLTSVKSIVDYIQIVES